MIWNEDNEVELLLPGRGRLHIPAADKTHDLSKREDGVQSNHLSAIGIVLFTPLHTVSNHSKNIINKRINC